MSSAAPQDGRIPAGILLLGSTGPGVNAGVSFDMRMLILSAAAAAIASCAPGAAQAAPMDYCEDYAEETLAVLQAAGLVRESPQMLRDRAFYECLNMDDEAPMPSDLARTAAAAPGEIEEGSTDEDLPAIAPAAETVTAVADRPRGRSRLEPGTDKWRAWCKKYFPRSFDEKAGTIVPSDTGKPEAC